MDDSEDKEIEGGEEEEETCYQFESFEDKAIVVTPFGTFAFNATIANVITDFVFEVISLSITRIFELVFTINVGKLDDRALYFITLTLGTCDL